MVLLRAFGHLLIFFQVDGKYIVLIGDVFLSSMNLLQLSVALMSVRRVCQAKIWGSKLLYVD